VSALAINRKVGSRRTRQVGVLRRTFKNEMTLKPQIALCLADAFLANAPARGPLGDALYARARATLGLSKAPWLSALVKRVLAEFGASLTLTRREKLARWIHKDLAFRKAWVEAAQSITVRKYFVESPTMRPQSNRFRRSRLPNLPTTGDVARWLGISIARLDWLAGSLGRDSQKRRPATPSLNHYTYRWLQKRSGGFRLLEIPKSDLRSLQRSILVRLLEHVLAHPAVHGFVRGRSSVTHAAQHVDQAVVVRIDLKDFFPSIAYPRIHAMFNTLGYPDPVARTLAGLCTHLLPSAALRRLMPPNGVPLTWAQRKQLQIPHLPQGAPTSPALANLCAYRLDCRLAKLAETCGARYSRYADDLVFSGDETFARHAERFHVTVCRIALEEGFEVNARKTRVMRRGVRQQITGVVVNKRPNITRESFDQLKATLHRLSKGASPDQANIAHLRGKIAYINMLHPRRAAKLSAMLGNIK
jgi:RNA-directed DNA polymerase